MVIRSLEKMKTGDSWWWWFLSFVVERSSPRWRKGMGWFEDPTIMSSEEKKWRNSKLLRGSCCKENGRDCGGW